jgi:hypothetical protein
MCNQGQQGVEAPSIWTPSGTSSSAANMSRQPFDLSAAAASVAKAGKSSTTPVDNVGDKATSVVTMIPSTSSGASIVAGGTDNA